MIRNMQSLQPVGSAERISTLDVVRGFALLGILLMNIVGFGLAFAYDDPTLGGGATGINLAVWIVMHILAEGKMRCLFSMIFGAGIILLTSRAEERQGSTSSADIYYRRNLWLMGAGILHAFLLWHGEILYPYALCALALYAFRKMDPKPLIRIGLAMLVIIAALNVYSGIDKQKVITEGQRAMQVEASGVKLTEAQEEAKARWQELRKHNKPTPQEIEKVNRQWRGSFWDSLQARAAHVWRWHSLAYYHYINLDIFSMMFFGMAFFKLGVFSGSRSIRFYTTLAAAGYAIGLPINSYTAYTRVVNNFDLVISAYTGVTYDIGRLSIAMAHASLLILMVKCGVFKWLTGSLAAVGQMALTNYLTHSIICSTIFCGYGFAMFGRLERHQLYYIVAGIWVFQLIVSPIWLRHFHFGPAEWAWRSLTYWRKQPMRKEIAVPAVA